MNSLTEQNCDESIVHKGTMHWERDENKNDVLQQLSKALYHRTHENWKGLLCLQSWKPRNLIKSHTPSHWNSFIFEMQYIHLQLAGIFPNTNSSSWQSSNVLIYVFQWLYHLHEFTYCDRSLTWQLSLKSSYLFFSDLHLLDRDRTETFTFLKLLDIFEHITLSFWFWCT